MRLVLVTVPEWPKLAWLSVCRHGDPEVACFIGPGVETADEWFCEGIWAGSYAEADFDNTDLVFASGGRVRDRGLIFVSPGTTLDRLHSLNIPDGFLVSNSLPCLLAVADASLLLSYRRYRRDFNSIRRGLRAYARELPTTAGPVRLTYFDNLCWDGTALNTIQKADPRRDFGSYAGYRHFLDTSMAVLTDNARAHERRHPFALISTLSTGYDSPTASVLARNAGCREAFGFDRGRLGGDDSGAPLAEVLGLQFHSFPTLNAPNADVQFLAAGAGNGGDVVFKSAEPQLAGRVVFTGFHGDKVWDTQTRALGPDIVRGDTSGSDLSEYRLSVGFVHVAVPFLGVRQVRDIHAISVSPKLARWDVSGHYNRPICRRIVEECGVPRDTFGVAKRGVFQRIPGPSNFLTPELRRDYFRWLRARRWQWILDGRIPPMPLVDAVIDRAGRLTQRVDRLHGHPWVGRLVPRAERALSALSPDFDPDRRRRLHDYVIHWALDQAKLSYPAPAPIGGSRQPRGVGRARDRIRRMRAALAGSRSSTRA